GEAIELVAILVLGEEAERNLEGALVAQVAAAVGRAAVVVATEGALQERVGIDRVAARAQRPLDRLAVDDAEHEHGVDAGAGEQEVRGLRNAVAMLLANE